MPRQLPTPSAKRSGPALLSRIVKSLRPLENVASCQNAIVCAHGTCGMQTASAAPARHSLRRGVVGSCAARRIRPAGRADGATPRARLPVLRGARLALCCRARRTAAVPERVAGGHAEAGVARRLGRLDAGAAVATALSSRERRALREAGRSVVRRFLRRHSRTVRAIAGACSSRAGRSRKGGKCSARYGRKKRVLAEALRRDARRILRRGGDLPAQPRQLERIDSDGEKARRCEAALLADPAQSLNPTPCWSRSSADTPIFQTR